MRYDTEHKQRTRERVLQEAARTIRAQGPHQLGVSDVMARAGLTHGGFYAHFRSRDELVAAAVAHMVEQGQASRQQRMQGLAPAEALARYIDAYLSPAHRDSRSSGCPLPYLAADADRLGQPVRQQLAQAVTALRGALAAELERLGHSEADADAASMVAELVGAMSIARAEPVRKTSDAILAASRQALKRRFGLERAA